MEQESRRNWYGAFFGFIFLIAGLAAAYGSAGSMIVGYIATMSWVEVPATLHDIRLVESRGESSTYSVKSDYSYSFDGITYRGDRVSLSTGSDNIGSYWEDLSRRLAKDKNSNEVSAIVNPSDPTDAILDRTLRWKTIVFGLMFLLLFGGFGAGYMWLSLKGTKARKLRLHDEINDGIVSEQKYGSWSLGAFGSVFFIMGMGMSLLILPDAMRDREYGAFFILIFVFVGLGIMYSAFRMNRSYRQFGPSLLFLDPAVPGVGGQLGGRVSINVPTSTIEGGTPNELRAKLVCTRKRTRSTRSRRRNVKSHTEHRSLWKEEVPVYLQPTANGIDASFLFEIPTKCSPTSPRFKGLSTHWTVFLEGDLTSSGTGPLKRSWRVTVEDGGAQASSTVNIPASFLEQAEQATAVHAKKAVLEHVEITEDAQHVYLLSKVGKGLSGCLIGMLFGAVFAAIGVYVVLQGSLFGLIFALVGGFVAIGSLYALGKSIDAKIDKRSLVLRATKKWFGITVSKQQGDVINADQFSIKHTSTSGSGNDSTDFYSVNFKSEGKKIQLASGIAGEKQALALVETINSRCFTQAA